MRRLILLEVTPRAGLSYLLGNEVVMGLGCGDESYDVDPLREANVSEGGARVN